MKYRKEVFKMNEKSRIVLLELETGLMKEFSGYWSLKEIYQFCRIQEKSKKWKVKIIEFGIEYEQQKKEMD